MIPEQWRELICSWAAANDDIDEVWLFGSRAKGAARECSDIDLAVLTAGSSVGERLAAFVSLDAPTGLTVPVGLMPLEDGVAISAVRDHGLLLYKRQQ